MGKDSKIAWTDHTFNPWMGCQKVSPGCARCYAERENARYGRHIWGPEEPRQRTSESYWKQPLKWNREAQAAGERCRVFCGSWCDVMEAGVYLDGIRKDLYELIDATPNLDWLLLTKRPENFGPLLPEAWRDSPRRNVWLMATVESAAYLYRTYYLKCFPAAIHGLSIEPLLGPMPTLGEHLDGIDWVIVGGESGPGARIMEAEWARSIREQCVAAGVPFFFKQWGEWLEPGQDGAIVDGEQILNASDEAERIGKKAAGSLLDGREWKQIPEVNRG